MSKEDLDKKRVGVERPLIKGPTYAYECGYADGIAEGRRLERRANLRIFDDDKLTTFEKVAKLQRRWLKVERDEKLAARSKRGKRGKNGGEDE